MSRTGILNFYRQAYILMYMYTDAHTYVHTYIHTYIHTHMHTHTFRRWQALMMLVTPLNAVRVPLVCVLWLSPSLRKVRNNVRQLPWSKGAAPREGGRGREGGRSRVEREHRKKFGDCVRIHRSVAM